jgi:hypothetical protein
MREVDFIHTFISSFYLRYSGHGPNAKPPHYW